MLDDVVTVNTNNSESKVGRPCKYESHVEPRLDEIYEWIKQGYTDYSIADNIGVGYSTYMKYKAEILELQEVYTRALHERNRLVMNKMFLKATGEKVTISKEKAVAGGMVVRLEEEQYIPPDVNAADLFLRNNDPEYKSAKSVEINNNTTNNYQLEDLEAKRKQILEEIKKAELLQAVDVECFPVEDK